MEILRSEDGVWRVDLEVSGKGAKERAVLTFWNGSRRSVLDCRSSELDRALQDWLPPFSADQVKAAALSNWPTKA